MSSIVQASLLFQFNQYSSLLLPFVVQGIIMTILLFRRGKIRAQTPDIFLGFLLFIYAIRITAWMLGFAGWYDVRDWHTTFMFYFPFNNWLAVGPLIYMYFLSVSNNNFRFRRKHLIHFIPIAITLLSSLFVFFMDLVLNHWIKGAPLPDFYATRGYFATNGLGEVAGILHYLEMFSVLTYMVLTLRLYNKYRAYIRNNFSDLENIDHKWLRNFLIVNLIGTVIWILFMALNLFLKEPLSYAEDWFSFFFLGVILYYLSIAGYYNGTSNVIVQDLKFNPEEPEEKASKTTEIDDLMRLLFDQLNQEMESNKPYLNSGLTLKELATLLKCNTGQLSKTINTLSGKNFNDFINGYRIKAFKKEVQNSEKRKQYSLLALAVDSGFNSKATFNRAFKKETGLSPSAYAKSIMLEE